MRSRDGAQDQENAPMSPDPFPRERLGSGNETKLHTDVVVCRLRVVKGRHDMIVHSWYYRPLPITYVCDMHILYIMRTNFVQITHRCACGCLQASCGKGSSRHDCALLVLPTITYTYVCVTNFVQITHTDVNMSGLAGLFVNIK